MMGEAKRRKRAGLGPRSRQPEPFDASKLAGRSLTSVFEEYGPKPGGGWKWTRVEGHAGELAYVFEHPEHPGIERIIGGTIELHYYRPASKANPFDEGADRYDTLAEAIQARAG